MVEREKREQGLQVGRRQQRPTPLQTGINAKILKILASRGSSPLIGEFQTAGVIGISLVAESSTDHIEKAVCTNSAWIFSETVGEMKFKFGEEIEQQLSDR